MFDCLHVGVVGERSAAHSRGSLRRMTDALHAYELALEPARQRAVAIGELRRLSSRGADPAAFHAFSIQWASLSVQLHEPTEQYLADASRRCAELGDSKLALTLLHIALEAIDVYRLLADDARALAQLWNSRRQPRVDMTSLLTQPATATIRCMHEHRRRWVLGSDPWAELASLFEIYALLGAMAEPTLAIATRLLGNEVRPALRSLHALRQQHRTGNGLLNRAMTALLTAHPERHDVMVAAGQRTLGLYRVFLLECCIASYELGSLPARQHA